MIKQTLTLVGLTLSLTANAALYDRGNGMIYDDTLDITWLQDANYARTTGYAPNGQMTWVDAKAWAAELSYEGFDDWRLPSTSESPAFGYNAGSSSEMNHMYYNNLNNSAGSPITTNTEMFTNVMSSAYWYEEGYSENRSWGFYSYDGKESHLTKGSLYFSWAVRDGDVSAVPVPAAAWLFGSALIALTGLKRRTC